MIIRNFFRKYGICIENRPILILRRSIPISSKITACVSFCKITLISGESLGYDFRVKIACYELGISFLIKNVSNSDLFSLTPGPSEVLLELLPYFASFSLISETYSLFLLAVTSLEKLSNEKIGCYQVDVISF